MPDSAHSSTGRPANCFSTCFGRYRRLGMPSSSSSEPLLSDRLALNLWMKEDTAFRTPRSLWGSGPTPSISSSRTTAPRGAKKSHCFTQASYAPLLAKMLSGEDKHGDATPSSLSLCAGPPSMVLAISAADRTARCAAAKPTLLDGVFWSSPLMNSFESRESCAGNIGVSMRIRVKVEWRELGTGSFALHSLPGGSCGQVVFTSDSLARIFCAISSTCGRVLSWKGAQPVSSS
mmetsp:Transcript_11638/g.43385  ORF Transcript_11638/g.43385 Transcript_11638/m.43385 type:complete len:233 (+) Transcript_11638:407-1105(+)